MCHAGGRGQGNGHLPSPKAALYGTDEMQQHLHNHPSAAKLSDAFSYPINFWRYIFTEWWNNQSLKDDKGKKKTHYSS